jgi:hypothetical protein
MKTLFLLLSFSTLSFAQNLTTKVMANSSTTCQIEMSVKQLTSDDLSFKCTDLLHNKPFKIENFKIKFRGHASVLVAGNVLNDTSKELARALNPGDMAYIYDIESITSEKLKNEDYKSLTIKIVD